MVGLLDIAPITKTVKVQDVDITVYGVSASGVAYLLDKFPSFKTLVTGGSVKSKEIVASAPDAIAAIIAAGAGSPGDKKAEAVAARLPLEAQLDLLEAIVKLTMPGGFGPFVDRLSGLLGSMGNEINQAADAAANTGTVQDTSSPLPLST